MEVFDKKSLTAEEQVELLIERGLVVNNKELAVNIIKRNGYYHLSSYMRVFQTGDEHLFIPETSFSQVISLYNFDKELRHITFNAIEKIEIAYRTAISNVMCKTFNSHWFFDDSAYSSKTIINDEGEIETQKEQVLKVIEHEIKKKKKKENEYAETFIGKYYQKYSSPSFPPFWMVAETFSIGALHRVYYSLADIYKRQVISYLGFKEDATFIALYSNWLQPICLVRNICAHHSRLFNRIFKIKAKQHKKIKEFVNVSNNSFYYVSMIINYFLKTFSGDNSFEEEILRLFNEYPDVNKTLLGFPENWNAFSITRIRRNAQL